jgi:hypothetical protein
MATMGNILTSGFFTTDEIRFGPSSINDAMRGNNTYTYIASFTVNFPYIDFAVNDYDTGISVDVAIGASSWASGTESLNQGGNDIYVGISPGYAEDLAPLSGNAEIGPSTGNGQWGNWQHLVWGPTGTPTGVFLRKFFVNLRMRGTPSGGGRAADVLVHIYHKPSNSAPFPGETVIFDNGPDGGNYFGSKY